MTIVMGRQQLCPADQSWALMVGMTVDAATVFKVVAWPALHREVAVV